MPDPKFFVYIVQTSTNVYYTGVAVDPKRRVEEHNTGKHGAKCLRGQRPVRLIWHTPFSTSRSEALKLEKRIKKLSHEQKKQMMEAGRGLGFQGSE